MGSPGSAIRRSVRCPRPLCCTHAHEDCNAYAASIMSAVESCQHHACVYTPLSRFAHAQLITPRQPSAHAQFGRGLIAYFAYSYSHMHVFTRPYCHLVMAGSTFCPSSSSQSSSIDQSPVRVVILEAKRIYQYTIPSFCAITMSLQHVAVQCLSGEDVEIFDGYIRRESAIDRTLPARVRIVSACLVPVSYFIFT